MTAAIPGLSHRLRPVLAMICLAAASVLTPAPALARGPDGIADVAEQRSDAVVNMATQHDVEDTGTDGRSENALPAKHDDSVFAIYIVEAVTADVASGH